MRKELALTPLHDLDTRQLPLMGYHQHQEFARYKAYSPNQYRVMVLPKDAQYYPLERKVNDHIIKSLP